jgi:regulator of nucleoside diphosphate kinase
MESFFMYSPDCGERVLTEMDHARLTVLQGVSDHPDLSSLLSLADLVPPAQVPADVITMHSRALIRDLAAGELQELTLCYPGDAVAGKGSTSVLSPIGAALLGRRVGDSVHVQLPAGKARDLRIETVLFQPEADAACAA